MKKFGFSRKGWDPNSEGVDGYDWNEAQPKWPLTRILKVLFVTVSILVWGIILLRLFTMNNKEYEKMILLNEKAAECYRQGETVVRIHSQTDQDDEGGVVISYPVYLEKAKNLQFTAKVNRRNIKPGKSDAGFTFILKETVGNETRHYKLSYFEKEKRFLYTDYRLCFEGVELREEGVYTFLVFPEDYSGGNAYPAGDSLFSFVVSSKDTYRNVITPKEDQIRYYSLGS